MNPTAIIQKIKTNYGGLPRSIYILFISRIINRIGGFVYAFLALYMKSKLGYSEGDIAEFIVLNGALSMISPFIGGAIADKRGRKAIYIGATSISALLFAACGFLTTSSPTLVPYLLIAASMFINLVHPIGNAMVADIVPEQELRKRSYALLYLGINVGVAIGPIIGGYLLANYVEWFFFGDAITTLISVGLIALFVPETRLTHEEMSAIDGDEKMETGFTLLVLLKRPVLLLFTIFSTTNAIVYAQSGFALPLHLENFFGGVDGPKLYGQIMSFNAVVVLLFTIAVTELLAKRRTIHALTLGAILNTLGFGMMVFLKNGIPLYFVSVFIWTIAEIVNVTNHSIFVMSNTPVNYRGRFNAIIGFISGIGFVLSPKIMSKAIELSGYNEAWIIIFGISIIGVIGFIITGFVEKWIKKNKKPLPTT